MAGLTPRLAANCRRRGRRRGSSFRGTFTIEASMPFFFLLVAMALVSTKATATAARRTTARSAAAPPAFAMFATSSSSSSSSEDNNPFVRRPGSKGKLLVLGGSGFLGGAVAKRASLEGYAVVSLSRRGAPPPPSSESSDDYDRVGDNGSTDGNGGVDGGGETGRRRRWRRTWRRRGSGSNGGEEGASSFSAASIDYRVGDARNKGVVEGILSEGGFVGIVHAVGILFDPTSGLAYLNRLASGSGSRPDDDSTYDAITRQTAFNAIEAAESYAIKNGNGALGSVKPSLPFVFLSAAEAGWTDAPGGNFVENNLTPGFMRRYLSAKRAVEDRLLLKGESSPLRPVIFRPSLIYSLDRPASLPPVAAFFAGNRILRLPFVDRPVTVQALSCAVVRSIGRDDVVGVQRYMDVDALSR